MITPAFAQGAAAASGADIALQVVPFVLIFVIMYFLILRPQQRRVKEHQALIKNVRRDDTIVTISQSRRMADALRKAGKPVELIELSSEDHWLSRGETRLQMLKATVAFLEKNNPPD